MSEPLIQLAIGQYLQVLLLLRQHGGLQFLSLTANYAIHETAVLRVKCCNLIVSIQEEVIIQICITALLIFLLATCQPSYAQLDLECNPDFVWKSNKINVMPSPVDIDLVAVSGNNSCATPHCVVGLGRLFYERRTTASLCGFFVRAIQSCPRYDGLDGDTFGCAGVVCASRPTPSSLSPSLAAWVMDLQSNTNEVNHD